MIKIFTVNIDALTKFRSVTFIFDLSQHKYIQSNLDLTQALATDNTHA